MQSRPATRWADNEQRKNIVAEAINDIRVFRIAETKVNTGAVSAWLHDLGADQFLTEDLPHQQITDPALLVALAAKQCYMAFQPSLNPNLTRVRRDLVEYLDNVLAQKHGSVLEHAVFTYAINGCSRVFTGEMNRHRAGVGVSERSMRYVRYENIEFWLPECFRDEGTIGTLEQRQCSALLLKQEFESQERAMRLFAAIWGPELAGTDFHVKKVLTSAFRRVIGMGIATGGVWTLNARALRHVLALRTDPGAEEEIVHVCMKIGRDMIQAVPELFGDFEDRGRSLVPMYWKV
jgi:thymidylate synthase (FAD)